jgi:acyl-CoA dehydrogenase
MFGLLMNWMRDNNVLPQISDTERQALEAGDVWIDGQLFAGKLDFDAILSENYDVLSPQEQAFLDGPTEELIKMVDAYAASQNRRVPDDALNFAKDNGFLSLQIDEKYGGNPVSTLAKSSVMAKLGGTSGVINSIVVISNSLGAAELLGHYGTEEQKNYFLPKLASGEFIPCFGLTEPTAGSDAASIKAEGVVFKDVDGSIKIKLNFRKRYITLAPIANLVSLAVVVQDPKNLLGKGQEVGITVVLIEVGDGVEGLHIGDYHQPIGDAFPNGPITGKDVIVPASDILGGSEYAGKGWRMLMEALAGGRMVSLPATGVFGIRNAAMCAGAYSMTREQFGIPIGLMEGVQQKVGHIAGMSYMVDGARVFGCSAVDNGIKPPVVSAIMKAYSTEIGQQCSKDAMDVLAGSGVMQGKNNIMGNAYSSAPVPVTVEGANIMTRTLMIFGQGATRCHPYAFNVVEAVESGDVASFRKNLSAWMLQFATGGIMTLVRGITRGFLTVKQPKNVAKDTKTYYRRLGWSATRYGFLTNLAMFLVGGKLKVKGNLTGRYADALAWMYMAISALRRFEAEGRKAEDLPLVQYSCEYALAKNQEAFVGIYQNFGGPVGVVLRTLGLLTLSINPLGQMPTDEMSAASAKTIQKFDDQFRRITQGQFIPEDQSFGLGRLLKAFDLTTQALPVKAEIAAAQKKKILPRGKMDTVAAEALSKGIVSQTEYDLLVAANQARLDAIEVDVFTKEEYYGDSDIADVTARADAAQNMYQEPTVKAVS